jgi:hypothetical protein
VTKDTDPMNSAASRRSKTTPETLAEAAALKRYWDAYKRAPDSLTQAKFGEAYEIGGQAAVGNFINGKIPLSLKAAVGFSRGLKVPIQSFSPRLAAKAASLTPQDEEPLDWRTVAKMVANDHKWEDGRTLLNDFIARVDEKFAQLKTRHGLG